MKLSSLVLYAALAAATLPAESPTETVETIMRRMDSAAPDFRGMSANVQMTTYTAVIKDTAVENGSFKMQRLKDKTVRAILDFSGEQDAKIVFLSGGTVKIFLPKSKLYQEYDVGKNSDVLNQYLLLGFGSSGKELMSSYDISIAGTETISGQEATKLVLKPKSDQVKEKLNKVEVWIPKGAAHPMQQRFYQAGGNYRTVQYSNVVMNPAIKGNLELHLPKGTKKQNASRRYDLGARRAQTEG